VKEYRLEATPAVELDIEAAFEIRHYLTFDFAGMNEKFVYVVSDRIKQCKSTGNRRRHPIVY